MGRLLPETIEAAPQFLNPVGQYELSLRGKGEMIVSWIFVKEDYLDLKISVIENLGATLNQFDTIDFTNNDLRKFDGFHFYLNEKHSTLLITIPRRYSLLICKLTLLIFS